MQISYGNGGWVQVQAEDMPGPVYLRYRSDRGRPVLCEFYLDAHDDEITTASFETLDLRAFTLFAMQDMGDWLERTLRSPGPDLSRLASHFATGFGSQARDWIADSMRAQIPGSNVPQREFARRQTPAPLMRPDPVSPPDSGLDDQFLRTVARNYIWAVREHLRPAPTIAKQAQCSPRTVHAWVRKARERGILEPTTRGRVA